MRWSVHCSGRTGQRVSGGVASSVCMTSDEGSCHAAVKRAFYPIGLDAVIVGLVYWLVGHIVNELGREQQAS